MKKRLLSLLLLAAMVLACVSGAAEDERRYVSGQWIYSLLPDGTAKLRSYNGFAMNVVLPEEIDGHRVTAMNMSFSYMNCLETVTIPAGITQVDGCAFFLEEEMPQFKELRIAEGHPTLTLTNGLLIDQVNGVLLAAIAPKAKELEIPEGVRRVASWAFASANKVETLVLPDSLTEIYSLPDRLKDVRFSGSHPALTLDNGLLIHWDSRTLVSALKNAIAADLVIPAGIETIGTYAFYSNEALHSVTLPESVVTIGEYAFGYCGELKTASLPEGLRVIGNNAFTSCYKLQLEALPSGLTDIGEDAFSYCSAISGDVVVADTVTNFASDAFTGSGIRSIRLPAGVKELKEYAFYGCEKLERVILPEGLEKIGSKAFYNSGIVSLDIPDSVTEIDEYAFGEAEKLTSVRLPANLTVLNSDVFFYCRNLAEVTLPPQLREIRKNAFSNCYSLATLTLPESLTHMEKLGASPTIVCPKNTTGYYYCQLYACLWQAPDNQ